MQKGRPNERDNFCRVFELPDNYPTGFCFSGGKPVLMLMVDWFNPWSPSMKAETWEEVTEILRPFLLSKDYVKPHKKYVLITDFGTSMVFSKEDSNGC